MEDGRHDLDELTLAPDGVVRKRRPRALWAVLAALGLAAGALAVTSGGGDGASPPGLPVAFGTSGGGEASMAADAMLARITYVAADGLPLLGGEGPAYRVRGDVDEAAVRALADLLGVEGDIVHDGPTWNVTGGTGSLGVYDEGGAQWWFSSDALDGRSQGSDTVTSSSGSGCAAPAVEPGTDPGQQSSGTEGCDPSTATTVPPCGAIDCAAAECPPGTRCIEPDISGPPATIRPECATAESTPCPEDTPIEPPVPTTVPRPAGLPSEAEARATALDLLTATGLDVAGADVTVDGPYDAWYVGVELRVEGRPSGLMAQVSVGAKGTIVSAAGFLGELERLGDYPVLDTRATIDRANAQSGIGYEPQGGVGVDAAIGVGGSATDPAPDTADCLAADTCVTFTAIGEPVPPQDATTITTVPPGVSGCAVQPDGTEICLPPELTCEEAAAAQDDVPVGAPEITQCEGDPMPEPMPVPDVEPVEVVLTSAVPSLVGLSAVDGTTDLYLVPGYRFTAQDSGQVDLPAVADEALTTPPTTNSSAVTPVGPPITGDDVPPPCEVLVEGDGSGTTHTVQPSPECGGWSQYDPVPLPQGDKPKLGVGYYVDVEVTPHCGFISVDLGGQWWWADGLDLEQWSTPTEGGTLTMSDVDRAEFVGDANRSKVAELRPWTGTTDRPLCN